MKKEEIYVKESGGCLQCQGHSSLKVLSDTTASCKEVGKTTDPMFITYTLFFNIYIYWDFIFVWNFCTCLPLNHNISSPTKKGIN